MVDMTTTNEKKREMRANCAETSDMWWWQLIVSFLSFVGVIIMLNSVTVTRRKKSQCLGLRNDCLLWSNRERVLLYTT